jgi:hypothetical protein
MTQWKTKLLFHSGKLYPQNEGSVMGAPFCAILSEILLQVTEFNDALNWANKLQVLGYFWYADSILITYNLMIRDINALFLDLRQIHPKLHFTLETKTNYTTNYLGLSTFRN